MKIMHADYCGMLQTVLKSLVGQPMEIFTRIPVAHGSKVEVNCLILMDYNIG